MTDWELLNKYAHECSQEAFAELAKRHLDMVYATALREVGDAALAEDVTQGVFIVLMQRAEKISPKVVIGGWLFQVARFASADARKKRLRRQRHETEAGKMREQTQTQVEPGGELAEKLDAAIERLGRTDREGIVLKYLEGKSYGEVALAMNTSEEAARKRLSRALRKLRGLLEKLGISTGDATLGAILAGRISTPAPAGVITHIQALGGGASGSFEGVTLAKEVLRTMKMQKIRSVGGITAAAALVLAVGAGLLLVKTNFAASGDAGQVATSQPQPSPQPTAHGPKDIVQRAYYLALTGKEDQFLACFDSLSQDQQTALRNVSKAMSATNAVATAIGKKFGAAAQDAFTQQFIGVMSADVTNATETIDADTAIVDIGHSGPGKIPMVKVNGEWKISADALTTFDPRLSSILAAEAEKLRNLAADIDAGKYASPDDLEPPLMKILRGPAADTSATKP